MKALVTTVIAMAISGIVMAQCSPFYLMKENVRYEYEMFDKKEKLAMRMSHTFKNISGTGDNINATLAQDIFDPKNGEKVSSSELSWKCEGGTLHFDMKSMSLSMDNGQQMNMGDAGMSLDVTGDRLDLPADLSVGQTLKDVTYNIKIEMGTLTFMNRTFYVKDRRVENQESVTTPAGTFECYKVMFTTSDEKGRNPTKSSIWYAKEAGMVKSENYNEGGKLLNRQVLVKIVK